MQRIHELIEWALALDPAAAFLLLLPFMVAAAGLWQYWLERRDEQASRAGGGARPAAR